MKPSTCQPKGLFSPKVAAALPSEPVPRVDAERSVPLVLIRLESVEVGDRTLERRCLLAVRGNDRDFGMARANSRVAMPSCAHIGPITMSAPSRSTRVLKAEIVVRRSPHRSQRDQEAPPAGRL